MQKMTKNQLWLSRYLASEMIAYGERDYSVYANPHCDGPTAIRDADKAFMAKIARCIETDGKLWG